jgi:hypothetical protein
VQRALLVLPRRGYRPRIAALALIDLILRLAWIGSRVDLRRPCFEEIEDELGLIRGLGDTCYDGPLIGGWVVEQWPARAHTLSVRH